ncbi:VanZ family protein [Streptosporangium sp. NBC_01495]|uniref:VanZ family protein n=1 Tax=Streptosporangium sp. NBC_01495 TaxID=2903899 RepID=UPI002E335356|nr:VanZ family protein [Streptosporangium sp. NBC_01495]
MDYALEVARILPIVVLASVLVYLGILLVTRRRGRLRGARIVAEFLLTGSVVTYVYVTQFMEFGNGLGDLLNLRPLHSFYLATEYGLANAESFVQVALNVLITVPIGTLFPLVFPGRWERVRFAFLGGLALSVATEALQLATGRNADIDDVLANTAGVALGTAIVVVVRAVVDRARASEEWARVTTWRVTAAAVTILGVVAPFVTVVAINAGDRTGVVYYGHLRPSGVRLPGSIPAQGAKANLYRFAPAETQEATLARLRRQVGVKGDCVKKGEAWMCSGEAAMRLVVHSHGTWSLFLDSGAGANPDPAGVPDEKAGLPLARAHLADHGIDVGTLTYLGVGDDWEDGYLHLDYASREHGGDTRLWGKVSVTLGEKGELVGLDDARIPVELVRSVGTISPRAAITIAQDVGAGATPEMASVTSVTASHYFDEDSGYLIPVWQVEGSLPNGNRPDISWNPVIDARDG